MSLTPRADKNQQNWIINGHMQISQRNTSFVAIANGAYCLDRYIYYKNGAMVHTVTQDTDVPTLAQAGYLFQNSLRMNLTTPDTAIAAADVAAISQKIEGYNFVNFAQKDFTLSFWVKATLPGIYCVAFQNSTNDRSYVAEYTINLANTWEQKTIAVAATPTGGTWNYTNGIGLEVNFTVAAGSNYQQTAGSWQANAGAKYATANQVNGVNTGATDFRITGVAVYEGTIASPSFSTFGRTFQDELAACQRYAHSSYVLGTAWNTLTLTNAEYSRYNGSTNMSSTWKFPVTMRIAPVLTLINPVNGGASARQTDIAADVVFVDVGAQTHGAYVAFNTGSISIYRWHWTVTAEL